MHKVLLILGLLLQGPLYLPNTEAKISENETSSLLFTSVTPGIDQAASSAAFFSAKERTFPRRVTLLPSTSTWILLASISAKRTSFFSIYSFRSVGNTRGLTVMRLFIPLIPDI